MYVVLLSNGQSRYVQGTPGRRVYGNHNMYIT